MLLAAFFVGTTIYGACFNFSPVPLADSWTGMVDFYLRYSTEPRVWWAQHNEHRIFFSKLLFLLDMRYFEGSGLLLIPVNIALLLLAWWVLAAYANKLIGFSSLQERAMVFAALGMWCLAWAQNQNIIFSFQSMFILVFLLPLASFYCWARALEGSAHARWWRFCSLLFAAATAQCMVNGLLVLPVLAVLSWYSERSRRWFFIILLFAAVSLALFLVGYEKSIGIPGGIAKFKADPLAVVKFALAYLGGPFYAMPQKIEAAVIAGGVAVALAAYLFLRRSVYVLQPYALALLAYIGYVFMTAGITAFGRVMLGVTFAMSSRYQTPALFMWAALLVLLLARSRRVAQWAAVALLAVAALLLPGQMRVFKLDTSLFTPQTKAVAALSLQLDIHDLDAKRMLALFYTEKIEDIFKRARQHKVAIFSETYAYPANQIGRPLHEAGGEACSGQITFQRLIDKNRVAYRVGGVLAPGSETVRYVLFGDAQGLVKGIAIPGRDRNGESGLAGPWNFDGYLFDAPRFEELRCVK